MALHSSHLIQSPSGMATFSPASFGFFSLRNQAMAGDSTHSLPQRQTALDLAEDVRPQHVDALLELLLIEETQRCGDGREKRVAVLWCVAEADHLLGMRHADRVQRHHRLGEDSAEVSVIAAEGEDLV